MESSITEAIKNKLRSFYYSKIFCCFIVFTTILLLVMAAHVEMSIKENNQAASSIEEAEIEIETEIVPIPSAATIIRIAASTQSPQPRIAPPPPLPEPKESEEPLHTEEELEILAIIIYQEAGGNACKDSTRFLVGNVFLNRVDNGYWGDSFSEVATVKYQYGSLYWTGIVWPRRATQSVEAQAVERAYDTARELLEMTIEERAEICPANVIWQAEFRQGTKLFVYQDGMYFCS